MLFTSNHEALMRRIDRCYLVASWAKAPERRARYVDLARRYRAMLGQVVTPQSEARAHS